MSQNSGRPPPNGSSNRQARPNSNNQGSNFTPYSHPGQPPPLYHPQFPSAPPPRPGVPPSFAPQPPGRPPPSSQPQFPPESPSEPTTPPPFTPHPPGQRLTGAHQPQRPQYFRHQPWVPTNPGPAHSGSASGSCANGAYSQPGVRAWVPVHQYPGFWVPVDFPPNVTPAQRAPHASPIPPVQPPPTPRRIGTTAGLSAPVVPVLYPGGNQLPANGNGQHRGRGQGPAGRGNRRGRAAGHGFPSGGYARGNAAINGRAPTVEHSPGVGRGTAFGPGQSAGLDSGGRETGAHGESRNDAHAERGIDSLRVGDIDGPAFTAVRQVTPPSSWPTSAVPSAISSITISPRTPFHSAPPTVTTSACGSTLTFRSNSGPTVPSSPVPHQIETPPTGDPTILAGKRSASDTTPSAQKSNTKASVAQRTPPVTPVERSKAAVRDRLQSQSQTYARQPLASRLRSTLQTLPPHDPRSDWFDKTPLPCPKTPSPVSSDDQGPTALPDSHESNPDKDIPSLVWSMYQKVKGTTHSSPPGLKTPATPSNLPRPPRTPGVGGDGTTGSNDDEVGLTERKRNGKQGDSEDEGAEPVHNKGFHPVIPIPDAYTDTNADVDDDVVSNGSNDADDEDSLEDAPIVEEEETRQWADVEWGPKKEGLGKFGFGWGSRSGGSV